jgi:hypothetical protein
MPALPVKTRIVDESEVRRDHESLSLYVITYHPRDYPTKVVVREQISRPGEVLILIAPIAVVDSIAEARAAIPRGLHRIPRQPSDDAVILETWV